MKMRLYLLGPMTGYFDDNRAEFKKWTAVLRAEGFEVVSPDELDEIDPVPEPTWEKLLSRDLPHLLTCGGGAALKGWRQSRGATFESFTLSQLGRPIFELPDLTRVPAERLPVIRHPVT